MTVDTGRGRTPGFSALCKSRCGAVMVSENGRFLGQEPDPTHPTGKSLCIKGRSAAEMVYNSQRELFPLKRTNPKGSSDSGWQRISWDEALDITTSALLKIRNAYGPETLAFAWTTPSGTPISDNLHWIERFANVYGSPNSIQGTEICNWHKDYAHAYTFGRSIGSPDFRNSDCIVLWGHNPSATWLDHATEVAKAKSRGAKLIVVDPRRGGFAARADQWLRVRPGADAVVALGLARELISNATFDRKFVCEWTNGPLLVRKDTTRFLRAADLRIAPHQSEGTDLVAWDEQCGSVVGYSPTTRRYVGTPCLSLDESLTVEASNGELIPCRTAFGLYKDACEPYTPEEVERIAWVDADCLRQASTLLASPASVSYYGWSGLGQHTNATQTDRAIATLMALNGTVDDIGGHVQFSKPPASDASGREFISEAQLSKCIEFAHSKLGPARISSIAAHTFYDAVNEIPTKVAGFFNFGRNLLINHADGDSAAIALRKLPFYVHADVIMTPTAEFADIFLPINTPWERDALGVGFEGSQDAENLIQLRQEVVSSAGESRSDAFVVFELAKRLGFGDKFWQGDVEQGMQYILHPLGITLEDLRKNPGGIRWSGLTEYKQYISKGFETQTGKVELFSEVFARQGLPALPTFFEPACSPFKGNEHFPLVLTSAKSVQYCHGQHRHIASLRKRVPDPEVTIHPSAAAARSIAEGEWVEIRSPHGATRMRAKFDPALDPRVVVAQYGWWQANQSLGLPAFDSRSDSGANYNRMIADSGKDPVSGSTGLRSSVCDVSPITHML